MENKEVGYLTQKQFEDLYSVGLIAVCKFCKHYQKALRNKRTNCGKSECGYSSNYKDYKGDVDKDQFCFICGSLDVPEEPKFKIKTCNNKDCKDAIRIFKND